MLRATAIGLVAAPALSAGVARAGGLLRPRPILTHGVAAGDVRPDGALVWARSDRPARMIVETAADEGFANARRLSGPLLTPDSDGTGRMRLVGLEPGQQVHYRVTLEDDDSGALSEPLTGTFRTAPAAASDITLHWSGDVAGQGFGINPDIGGMTVFAAMAARGPDLFIHSGDTVYADGPLKETVTLKDGRVWRNVVTEAKSAVAQTLDQFRGQHSYNLLDENYRRFNALVAQSVQWDDHETVNNWYPGEVLDLEQYQERDVDVLAERAFQAFHEWQPLDRTMAVDGRIYRKIAYGPLLDVFVLDMRTYKDVNTANLGAAGQVLGAAQRDWLLAGLAASTARWKIIANDLPLGLVVPDGDSAQEGVGNGDAGPPLGRERELAEVLTGIKRAGVTGVVWLTADVHYTAAHHYSPERAAYQEFDEFWEFVSGPLNAGAFGPNTLDGTFGPRAEFVHAPDADNQGAGPMEGFQHFGEVKIDGGSGALTVNLCDGTGAVLYSKTLET